MLPRRKAGAHPSSARQEDRRVPAFPTDQGPWAEAGGKKSLAITVVLQPQERTLTDAEIEGFSKRLITQVEKATGRRLRG
jgi:phenylalanyl-tRNA synthetase beta chain